MGSSGTEKWMGLLVHRNQAPAYGVADEFRLVPQAESLHQSSSVILYRPWADIKPCGNLHIRFSFCRHLQHLTLPWCEGFVRIECARLALFDEGVNGDLGHRRTQVTSACGCLSHGVD